MRFTLCKLFLGVTMAALACAGMTLHTRLWAESIVSFSIVLYAAVAILSFRGGGQVRAFRVAFAVVGGGYLLLVLCNMFTPIRDLLVTNRVLVLAGRSLQIQTTDPIKTTTGGGAVNTDEYGWNNLFAFSSPTANPQIPAGAFFIIGHCVWSWLLALMAGCFAAFACRPHVPAAT